MEEYLSLFIDKEYPEFIDKYLNTKTLNRIKHVTQFCGCDYTKLYNPLFLYTRYSHSLVVAHMTWHFTKNKKETIIALLHDIGTPCFAHCIDYVFGDYLNQESSEKKISTIIQQDREILEYLKEDGIELQDLEDFANYPILENKTPQLCTDRLDGVLHTCYIWLHTHTLDQIQKVYNNIKVLKNETENPEIGFNNLEIAEDFVRMTYIYAKELRGNKDKYVMKYISEIVKLAFDKNLVTLDDLYQKKEEDIVEIFNQSIPSWSSFNEAETLIRTEKKPKEEFYISFACKKRNTIPLVETLSGIKRIVDTSDIAKRIYQDLDQYNDSTYAYVKKVKRLDK